MNFIVAAHPKRKNKGILRRIEPYSQLQAKAQILVPHEPYEKEPDPNTCSRIG